ncbi:MAG: S-layer homology domain-containing protein [Defluviitaleaceae bacterium]|nr:S-layer homology domain-containing protein [Defluviitaleaceae bacterium]
MKSFKRVSIFAVVTALVVLVMAVSVAANEPSAWAAEQVNAAIAENLVPQNLQSDYTQATTRAEFSALAVALYEAVRGEEITGRVTFDDTTDINVEKAAYIGVVTGVGGGRFNPDGTLTREQAAVMLDRLTKAIEIPMSSGGLPHFYDMDEVSDWAVSAIINVNQLRVMGGVGNNLFAPQQPYTREQSIVSLKRVFDFANSSSLNLPAVEREPIEQTPATGGDNYETPSLAEPTFEVGTVTLIANGTEHTPIEHFSHGAGLTDDGLMFSASGAPISWANILDTAIAIPYSENLQIVIDGEYASITTYQHATEMYYQHATIIGVFAQDFTNGTATISLPEETGTFIVFVDVNWSSGDFAFTLMRYAFKIEK